MKYLYLGLFLCSFALSQAQNSKDSLKLSVAQSTGIEKAENLYQLSKEYTNKEIDSSLFFLEQMKDAGFPFVQDSLNMKYHIGRSIAFRVKKDFEIAASELEIAKDFATLDKLKKIYHLERAFLFYDQSNFSEAKEEFQEGLSFLDVNANEFASEAVVFWTNIGSCSQQLGQYEESVGYYQNSLRIAKENKLEKSESRALNNISILYKKLEDFDKAEEYIKKALEIDKRTGAGRGLAITHLNLGLIQRSIAERDSITSKYNDSKENYNIALEISEEGGFNQVKGAALANLANLENSLGNYSKAIEYGKKARDFNIATKNVFGEMITTLNLGESYRRNKQYVRSEIELDKSLVLAKKIEFQDGIESVYQTQTLLYEDSKQYEKAYKAFKNETKLKDSLESVGVKNNINELEIKFETEKKEKDLAETRANLAESKLSVKKRENLIYGSLGLALIFGLIGYLFYNQQKLKNRQLVKEKELTTALTRIETQNRLQEQRLRISRDLHDNIGAQLTFIISSIDNLKFGMKDASKATENRLSKISEFTTQTIYELRDTIWAMNKDEVSFEDLQSRISNFIEKANDVSENTIFSFTISDVIPKEYAFTSVQGMNIYRMIQESVNNALKHAQAKKISVDITSENKQFLIEIKDDGIGFNETEITKGNGYNSIQKRAREIGAIAEISSMQDYGTKVSISIPDEHEG